jgi:peptidyl-tRNA hydrolase, PTH1 family
MADRWLIVGLGNPGREYEKTRHNIGQLVLDQLSENQKFSSHKSRMQISEIKLDGQNVVLAKSLGYMNESGGPAKSLADFYKIDLDKIIAIHDELDLPFNNLRIKLGGGIMVIMGLSHLPHPLASADYYRIRMGIGRPIGEQDPADFVLKPFSKDERAELDSFTVRAAQAISSLILNGIEKAQTAFNS